MDPDDRHRPDDFGAGARRGSKSRWPRAIAAGRDAALGWRAAVGCRSGLVLRADGADRRPPDATRSCARKCSGRLRRSRSSRMPTRRSRSPPRSEYGLGANIYTQNLTWAMRAMQEIKAGTFWINDPLTDNDAAPFGGMRKSGMGRELGEEGLDAFRETKHVHLDFMPEKKGVLVPVQASAGGDSRSDARSVAAIVVGRRAGAMGRIAAGPRGNGPGRELVIAIATADRGYRVRAGARPEGLAGACARRRRRGGRGVARDGARAAPRSSSTPAITDFNLRVMDGALAAAARTTATSADCFTSRASSCGARRRVPPRGPAGDLRHRLGAGHRQRHGARRGRSAATPWTRSTSRSAHMTARPPRRPGAARHVVLDRDRARRGVAAGGAVHRRTADVRRAAERRGAGATFRGRSACSIRPARCTRSWRRCRRRFRGKGIREVSFRIAFPGGLLDRLRFVHALGLTSQDADRTSRADDRGAARRAAGAARRARRGRDRRPAATSTRCCA